MGESIAEELGKKQREISVSEFFEKNKHILGFGSSTRALLTSVKEAVDNALDACEEVGILPELQVEVKETEPGEFRITVEDNGPGIVKKQVPNVFGKLLYGSRFHSIRQSRGQQGIGISAVVMYGQLTTGKPAVIRSKTAEDQVAAQLTLILDTKKNAPDIIKDEFVPWDGKAHGTRIEVHIKARAVKGKASVAEYLRGTAIVNPHAEIKYSGPDEEFHFQRVSMTPPPKTNEIKPHPKGLELGQLLAMAKATKARRMKAFLCTEFSRISYRVADEILEKANLPDKKRPKTLTLEEAKAMMDAIKSVKIMAPPTDCLSPIGEVLIKKGLKNVLMGMRPDYYVPPVTRPPTVHQGNPFQVEVGMVFGGDLNKEGAVDILRFANRVPLLYQQGDCVMTKAISEVDWRRYGLDQRGGKGIPYGPAIILVHVASTKIPFTSEAKEAVADIDVVHDELVLALRDIGRKTKIHLNKRERRGKAQAKFDLITKVIPQIAKKSAAMVDKPVPDLARTISKIMGVVWIDGELQFEKGNATISVKIHNFTGSKRDFKLYSVLPIDKIDLKGTKPTPDGTEGTDRAYWNIRKLEPAGKRELTISLKGVDRDEFDENEFFVDGLNPAILLGADPLPGDWNIHLEGQPATEPGEAGTESEGDGKGPRGQKTLGEYGADLPPPPDDEDVDEDEEEEAEEEEELDDDLDKLNGKKGRKGKGGDDDE